MGAHGRAAVPGWGLVRTSVGALGRRRGFTLIELLVVIGIIAVLAAIVIPVYTRAMEKGRQATCLSNMHSIAIAIRMYQQDYRAFPAVSDPTTGAVNYGYDPVTGYGGITALYLGEYISNSKSLRCPNDQTQLSDYMAVYAQLTDLEGFGFTGPTIPETGQPWSDAADNGRYYRDHYSSYNCAPGIDPGANGSGVAQNAYELYNANGYAPGTDGLSLLIAPTGFGSKYPGLCNRWAPDETIITHCPYHRDFFGNQPRWQDIVVRVGGDAETMRISNYDWVNQPPG